MAMKKLKLHAIWWLVSPQNPLKSSSEMAPLRDRLASARKQARHPRMRVTSLESDMGTRYTANSVRRLQQVFPRTKFCWVMGADNLIQIHRWGQWRRIFETLPVAVFDRPIYSLPAQHSRAAIRYRSRRTKRNLMGKPTPRWSFFHTRKLKISATEIRKCTTRQATLPRS